MAKTFPEVKGDRTETLPLASGNSKVNRKAITKRYPHGFSNIRSTVTEIKLGLVAAKKEMKRERALFA